MKYRIHDVPHIVIDGKALRAAAEKIKDRKAPYILNAMDAATNLVIAQAVIPEKTNEWIEFCIVLEKLVHHSSQVCQ